MLQTWGASFPEKLRVESPARRRRKLIRVVRIHQTLRLEALETIAQDAQIAAADAKRIKPPLAHQRVDVTPTDSQVLSGVARRNVTGHETVSFEEGNWVMR